LRPETHGWFVSEVKSEEPKIHPVKVKPLADPERQNARIIGSRCNPQGARFISSRFALLAASRAF
jgi:hypothetical protein